MKNNEFTVKDSSLAFVLSIVFPNLLAILIFMFAGFFTDLKTFETTTFYKILSTLISQIAFLLVFIFISRKSKVSFKAVKTKKFTFKNFSVIILISLICLFLISPLINVYDAFLTSIGIKEQTLSISLDSPLNLIYLIFSLAIIAPICEELVFRGIICGGLREKGVKNAVLISALMFMLMHLSIHQTIYQFILGIILALIYIYTENIFSTILVHFVNNAGVLLINYFSPSFFEFRFLTSNYIILAVVLFLVGLFLIFNLLKVLKGENFKDEYLKTQESNETENGKEIRDKVKPKYLTYSLVFGVLMWIITVILSI